MSIATNFLIRATKELLTPDNKSHYLAIDTVGSKFLSPSRLRYSQLSSCSGGFRGGKGGANAPPFGG